MRHPGTVKTGVDAVVIRGARPEDATRLAQLSAVLGYPVQPEILRDRLDRLLESSRDVVFLAELPKAGTVGWIHGAEQALLESDRRCEILGLVVDPEHRGKKIGRRLVEAVERWAEQRGLKQMAVRSNVTRPESHPFYERLGYVRAKTQHAYRKPLSPTA
jgi:GNAT superfamily N-acetyltransferase